MDDESGDNCTLSRSAEASQKLKENLRSGTFVVDERSRGRFENKCRGFNGHAIFRYKENWQVKHSKCVRNMAFLNFFFDILHDFICCFTLHILFSQFHSPRKDNTRAIDPKT